MIRNVTSLAVVFLMVLGLSGIVDAQSRPKTKMLADFEDGTAGIFTAKCTIGDSRNLDGKVAFLKPRKNLGVASPKVNWKDYNYFKLDVYNPTDNPGNMQIVFFDDTQPHGYYSRINRYLSAKPGRSTISLYIPELRRGEGTPKDMMDPRPFHWDKVSRLLINSYKGSELEIDNIRVEKVDISIPKGILAYDFGPTGSPVLPGMTEVTPETKYSDRTGFGWSRKRALYSRKRHSAPDNLVRDWISGSNSTFSAKVPNGEYVVWLICEDPGEWELYQNFTSRSIEIEGDTVMSETMNGKQFLDKYFHFSETEDLPGDDIYRRYVEWRYPERRFNVRVNDGRLDLTIHGPNQYACTVNGLVIYPKSRKTEAEKFIAGIMKRRKDEFKETWNERLPDRGKLSGGIITNLDYLVFRRDMSKDVQVFDTPKKDELLKRAQSGMFPTVKLTAARGEFEPFTFSIHALKDLPGIRAEAGEFRTAGGKTLPTSAIDVRTVRYKFKRRGFSGAGVYSSVPWILVDGRKSSVKKGMTRRYWVTVHVPKDQAAGVYKGKIRVMASAPFEIPVELRVLPFELPDADVGMGMFGVGGTIPYFSYFPENRDRNTADRVRSLQFARDHGLTHVAIGRGIEFKGFENGKAKFDCSKAKAQVEQARKLGFTFIDVRGSERGIIGQAIKDKGALARKHGFASPDDLVKEVFTSAIKSAADAGLPTPAWAFVDEPPDSQAPEFVKVHERIRRLANARSITYWSPRGKPTHKLLDVTSICSLNVATIEHIKRARAAGNTVYLNNQGRNRWAFGLYMWKAREAGVSVYQQFAWMGSHADPYFPLDSYEDDSSQALPDRVGKLRPQMTIERIREGIDDYRYTLALTRAIAKAKGNGTAKEAQSYLDSILNRIKFEVTRRDRRPQMTNAQLNGYRSRVQDYLVKLAAKK